MKHSINLYVKVKPRTLRIKLKLSNNVHYEKLELKYDLQRGRKFSDRKIDYKAENGLRIFENGSLKGNSSSLSD